MSEIVKARIEESKENSNNQNIQDDISKSLKQNFYNKLEKKMYNSRWPCLYCEKVYY